MISATDLFTEDMETISYTPSAQQSQVPIKYIPICNYETRHAALSPTYNRVIKHFITPFLSYILRIYKTDINYIKYESFLTRKSQKQF